MQVVVLADGGSLLVRETWLQQTKMQVSKSGNDSLCHTVAKESGLDLVSLLGTSTEAYMDAACKLKERLQRAHDRSLLYQGFCRCQTEE